MYVFDSAVVEVVVVLLAENKFLLFCRQLISYDLALFLLFSASLFKVTDQNIQRFILLTALD